MQMRHGEGSRVMGLGMQEIGNLWTFLHEICEQKEELRKAKIRRSSYCRCWGREEIWLSAPLRKNTFEGNMSEDPTFLLDLGNDPWI